MSRGGRGCRRRLDRVLVRSSRPWAVGRRSIRPPSGRHVSELGECRFSADDAAKAHQLGVLGGAGSTAHELPVALPVVMDLEYGVAFDNLPTGEHRGVAQSGELYFHSSKSCAWLIVQPHRHRNIIVGERLSRKVPHSRGGVDRCEQVRALAADSRCGRAVAPTSTRVSQCHRSPRPSHSQPCSLQNASSASASCSAVAQGPMKAVEDWQPVITVSKTSLK